MRWLAIDTSGGTTVGVVEAADSGEMVEHAVAVNPDARGHVEALAPMIQTVLADSGMRARDVDVVVVGTGPAPFTGLRVGIATAAAFARAAGCGLRGVCSLDAIALGADYDDDSALVVTTDARRREVYWAAYEGGLGPADPLWRLQEPAVGPPSDVLDWVADHRSRVVGPGVAVHSELALPHSEPELPVRPLALVDVAATMLRSGLPTSVSPQYLRRPDIHVAGARKRAT